MGFFDLFKKSDSGSCDPMRGFPAPEVKPFGLEVKTCFHERYSPRPVEWDGVIYWLSTGDQELIDRSISFARDVASYAASGRKEAKNAFKVNDTYIKTPITAEDISSYGIRTRSITVATDAYTKNGNKRKFPLSITVPCTVESKTRRRAGGTAPYTKGTTITIYFDWEGAVGKVDVVGIPDFRTRWTAKLKTSERQLALYRLERKVTTEDGEVKKDRWDL